MEHQHLIPEMPATLLASVISNSYNEGGSLILSTIRSRSATTIGPPNVGGGDCAEPSVSGVGNSTVSLRGCSTNLEVICLEL